MFPKGCMPKILFILMVYVPYSLLQKSGSVAKIINIEVKINCNAMNIQKQNIPEKIARFKQLFLITYS